ncbi:MAG TPA: BON domain-containing protein [Nitrospiria bacterium]|nr:BON domain-containing protein [Nitrospiria bacterium]
MKELTVVSAVAVLLLAWLSMSNPPGLPHAPSERWIKTALESEMERDALFDLDHVRVIVDHGTVKLGGTVRTGDEMGEAELLAMATHGTQAIQDNIHVMPTVSRNLKLDQEIRSDLLENPTLRIRDLRVRIVKGDVSLHGIVHHRDEKGRADELVALVPGVDAIHDRMEVLHRA